MTKRINRKAWGLIVFLCLVVTIAGGWLLTIRLHKLFGPHPTILYLPPSEWGFHHTNVMLINGSVVTDYVELFQLGFFTVYRKKPITLGVLKDAGLAMHHPMTAAPQ